MLSTLVVKDNHAKGTNIVQINAPATNPVIHIGDDSKEKILTWLSTIAYEKHHKHAKQGRTPGTCGWLSGNEKYSNWRCHSSSILWLRGDPGTGKTKLTSFVIDNYTEEIESSAALMGFAYFYCDRNEPIRQDPEEIFCALLKQLSLVPVPDQNDKYALQPLVVADYDRRAEKGFASGKPTTDECVDLILGIAGVYSQITIIIDALDEVGFENRQKILEVLQKLGGSMRIFVASRNEDDIRIHFQTHSVPFHYIQPHDSSNDINNFITRELEVCIRKKMLLHGDISEWMRSRISESLREKAGGMFLWADLQLKQLCRLRDEDDIVAALEHLPEGLEETYDVIWRNISQEKGTGYQIAIAALQWTACAGKPLTVNELVGAVYSSGVGKIKSFEVILAVCHNLIVLDQQEDVVRFTHLSAREYLERRFSTQCNIQASVLKTCLRLLTNRETDELETSPLKDILDYSTRFWPHHITRSRAVDWRDEETRNLISQFMGTYRSPSQHFARTLQRYQSGRRKAGWDEKPYEHFYSANPTPLFAASFCNLGDYLRDSCIGAKAPDISEINMQNRDGRTALCLASMEGHASVVRLLVDKGADVNSGEIYSTPLEAAAIKGELEVVRLLVDNGANLKARNGKNFTALIAAANAKRWDIATFLINKGADVNAMEGRYTALRAAAEAGELEVVRLLVKEGAEVNAETREGKTTLRAAAEAGEWEVVRFLVDIKAEVNDRSGKGCIVLGYAASAGQWEIVELLVDNGANLSVGKWRGRALGAATKAGKLKVVRKLLDNGLDVNSGSRVGCCALLVAAEASDWEIVKLLVDRGADVNFDKWYFTALWFAAKAGQGDVVKLLVDKGADVNAGGKEGYTALVAAAEARQWEVVRLLVHNAADVDAGRWSGRTALGAAARLGEWEVVRLLVDKGADVNVKERWSDCTVLGVAVEAGEWEMVRFLVNNGAFIGWGDGRTALIMAASTGEWEVAKLLVENGADVNVEKEDGSTVLGMAAEAGQWGLVNLLVDKGANGNVHEYAGTVLGAAVEVGHLGMVRFL